MKFSEMPYTRPDYAAAAKELDSLTARLRGAAQIEGKLHVQTSCVFAHSIILPGKSQRRALPFSRKDGMIQKNARRHRHGYSRPLP